MSHYASDKADVGDIVIVQLIGVVKQASHGHGVCYEIEMPKDDWVEPRKIWVSEDELISNGAVK